MKRRAILGLLGLLVAVVIGLLIAAAVNVTNANAVQVTAWATVALAAVGVIGIGTSIALAYASLRTAAEAKQATALQHDELDVIKRQLSLQEKQFAAAQAASRPRLSVTITSADASLVAGDLAYMHGTEPGRERPNLDSYTKLVGRRLGPLQSELEGGTADPSSSSVPGHSRDRSRAGQAAFSRDAEGSPGRERGPRRCDVDAP